MSSPKLTDSDYLPASPLKSRKFSEYTKLKSPQYDLSSNDENFSDLHHGLSVKKYSINTELTNEDNLKSIPREGNPTSVSTTSNQSVTGNNDSINIGCQDEAKAWQDNSSYDWIHDKYRLEQERPLESNSRKSSSTQYDEGFIPDEFTHSGEITQKLSEYHKEFGHPNLGSRQNYSHDKIRSIEKQVLENIDGISQHEQYKCVETNGSMFVGQAIKHGIGILFDKDPESNQTLTYKGEFKYDLRDGMGQQIYKDGTIYNGTWKADKPHGFGTLLFTNGMEYEGEFLNGVSSGSEMIINAHSSNLCISYTKENQYNINDHSIKGSNLGTFDTTMDLKPTSGASGVSPNERKLGA